MSLSDQVSSDVLRMALNDFGLSALIGGQDLVLLFDPVPNPADPYVAESRHEGPLATMLRADLEAAALWPLEADLISIAGTAYNIVRKVDVFGVVTLYLREAE